MSREPAPPLGADVIVPVYADVELTRRCLEAVLDCSGPALRRLIAVDDRAPDVAMPAMLAALRRRDERVRLLRNEENLGFVRSCNRGLALRSGDAVVLNSDTRVTEGWLDELLAVSRATPRIGAVCPLSNNASLCSVPSYGDGVAVEALEALLRSAPGALASLPRWTELPTGVGFCLLMRGELLDALGPFDPAFGRGYHEENDWCQRIQAAGYTVARANRAVVFHLGGVSFGGARVALDAYNARRLVRRAPHYLGQTAAFERGLDARGVANALAARAGPLRVCLELGPLDGRGVAQGEAGERRGEQRGEPAPELTAERRYVRRVVELVLAEAVASESAAARLRDGMPGEISPGPGGRRDEAGGPPLVVSVRGGEGWLPPEVPRLPDDAPLQGYHLVHCFGVPGRAALAELLACEAALVFTPVSLAALATPFAHPTWALTERERAHVWALCEAASAVLAPEPAMRAWLERWIGEPGKRSVGVLPEFPSATRANASEGEAAAAPAGGRGRRYLLHLGGDAPWSGLQRLLEAWALRSGVLEAWDLVLEGPPSGVPDGPFSRPDSWPRGVRRATAAEVRGFDSLVAGAEAVLELATVPGLQGDLRLARSLGTPVLSFGVTAPESLADALASRAERGPSRAAPGGPPPALSWGSDASWRALYGDVVRGAADTTARRPLAVLLSGGGARGHSPGRRPHGAG